MEKPIFPSKYMRITQGYNIGTHKDSFAIDNADKDSGISNIYAPFTGIIKKIYQNDANEVWLESTDKVEYPDGTIDYMNIMFAHCNDISNLFVGKIIKQNEAFYKEGTKGNVTGNHCHIECGKGRFTGTGWHKNNAGYWSINNGKRPEECLWLDDSINISFKKYLPKSLGHLFDLFIFIFRNRLKMSSYTKQPQQIEDSIPQDDADEKAIEELKKD